MHAPRHVLPHCKRTPLGAEEYCPDWCGCQRWGSSSSPTYFRTRHITRLNLYISRKIPRIQLRSPARYLRISHTRTLSNSAVSISITSPTSLHYYIDLYLPSISITKPDQISYLHHTVRITIIPTVNRESQESWIPADFRYIEQRRSEDCKTPRRVLEGITKRQWIHPDI